MLFSVPLIIPSISYKKHINKAVFWARKHIFLHIVENDTSLQSCHYSLNGGRDEEVKVCPNSLPVHVLI